MYFELMSKQVYVHKVPVLSHNKQTVDNSKLRVYNVYETSVLQYWIALLLGDRIT